MTTVELRLPVGHRGIRRRIGAFLLLPALLLLVAGVAVWEIRTFRGQAWLLSTFARGLGTSVGAGPAPMVRLPRPGPYDDRLGYSRLPDAVERLRTDGWQVAAQARLAPRHARLVTLGMAPVYREKTQAGLEVLDPRGQRLYQVRYPDRIYPGFEAVPPLVARTLTFIENRELLDPVHPFRNPAVEWGRLATAVFAGGVRLFNPAWKGHGGSTLATQLEKSRHSPGGRTAGPAEKVRQMATASLRAYRDGPLTESARRRTLVEYLNALPLAALPGYGEVHGLGDGLWAWYGADFDQVNRLLAASDQSGLADPETAVAYRQVLSLLLAQRRPAYYLVEDPAALERLTDSYLEMLDARGLLPRAVATSGPPLALRSAPPARDRSPLYERKADLAVRSEVAALLGVNRLYDLDRVDLTVTTTLDAEAQQAVTAALLRLAEPDGARKAGVAPLLGGADPAGVLYSFTLYERSAGANAVRVQVDSADRPLDLNDGAKLELGSTAKLRTLITYLELVAELHDRYAELPRATLERLRDEAPDPLTRWVLAFLTTASDTRLEAVLEAAMERRYSASPWEGFFTGGGLHHFRNFDDADNGRVPTVRQAFHRSVNLVFIRIMRDLVEHYRVGVPGSAASILEDREHPLRTAYLERFADREGAQFLRRYYREYQGTGPEAALAAVVAGTRPIPKRLAAIHRSTRPHSSFEEFDRFLRTSLPHSAPEERIARRLYEELAPDRLSLADRGYVARVHPLELWLVEYLSRHPDASLADVLEASAGARQEAYGWLHRTRHKRAQDRSIRTLLEVEAFVEIHRAWRRLGYPFDTLVPSYATAIGSSADRPAALAELLGILANDGLRRPTARLTRLHFGAATPFETVLERQPFAGERVLHPEVAALARQELLGVVRSGTAARARKTIHLADGTKLEVGGKTGTGDNRQKRSGGSAGRAGVLNRTASFVFVLGDRFYGTVVAYVPGQAAADYRFTSSTAVQVFNYLLPALEPVLSRPVSLDEWSLFREPTVELERSAPPRQIAAAAPTPPTLAPQGFSMHATAALILDRAPSPGTRAIGPRSPGRG
ncbi:MAG TPA: transglycosylase domain-containing protein, partial [Thermoanaerobaculia bacterium]|nr:transglycosylase domain-containing protein [Thermoanaerobaculia bacterium]